MLAVGLGKFLPPLSPRWDGFGAARGMEMEPGSPHREARCEISHGQTSESCGVPRRRGTEKMKRGGGDEEEERKQQPRRNKNP